MSDNNARRLNESPHPKAGKSEGRESWSAHRKGLNESPRPKAGKRLRQKNRLNGRPSLNESPRPKAGNRGKAKVHRLEILASMKVPTRKRGN